MKTMNIIAGFAGAISILQVAAGQVISTPPGISAFPFAGADAGKPPLISPKFGLIDLPGGLHSGEMLIAELAGNDLVRIDALGNAFPYTMPFGPFPGGAFGIDIDGPIASLLAGPPGLYGGPAMLYVGQGPSPAGVPPIMRVMPGGPWIPWLPVPANPGMAQLQIDRTPGFRYGGFMYVSDWGNDQSDAIWRVTPAGPVMFAPIPNSDPRYFTFDLSGGATGFGPGNLWVSSYQTGAVFSITPGGMAMPPIAVLQPDLEGLAFGPGDPYFGIGLYACNLALGDIDIIMPGGLVTPFSRGLESAAYPMFVTIGPFAYGGNPTLYVADGIDSVWMFVHCPADLNDDSLVDFGDYLTFLNLYNQADPKVDYNKDGLVDFSDYLEFLNFYDAGC
ncbi:MAG: hypothetical protein IT436_11645 [Phycisphaerales bacterium]|nr:hypothetical protein [Phycisphaerales bacterium]